MRSEVRGKRSGAPKETSQQSGFVLGSIPRYIKSPPGESGVRGIDSYYLLLILRHPSSFTPNPFKNLLINFELTDTDL